MSNNTQAILANLPDTHERMEPIVERIIDVARLAIISYNLDRHGTLYSIGTFTWDRIFNSLPQILEEDENWSVSTNQNVLVLKTTIGGESFSFYVQKVASDNRLPLGAKYVKSRVKEKWLLLDESLREMVTTKKELFIAYDITTEKGLGKITIDEFTYFGKKEFYSKTIAVLYDSATDANVDLAPKETMGLGNVVKRAAKVRKNVSKS